MSPAPRVLAALALSVAGCGVLLPPAGPPTRAPVLAVLHRIGCLGPCRDYQLTVYDDGTVEYEGHANVYVLGKRTTTIGTAGAALLRRHFAQADFIHLAHRYTTGDYDVMGLTELFYRGKHVEFEVAYAGAPWTLDWIANDIDVLSNSRRWTEAPVAP